MTSTSGTRFRGLIGLLLFISGPVYAEPIVYFSPQDNVQQHIVEAIEGCRTSLDAALFEVTSPVLAHALQQAAERGVTIRILTDDQNKPRELSAATHLEIRYLSGHAKHHHGYMHNKFAIFDKERIVTGSFNWTRGAQWANYENALFDDDSSIVDAFQNQFAHLWDLSTLNPTPARHKRSKKRFS